MSSHRLQVICACLTFAPRTVLHIFAVIFCLSRMLLNLPICLTLPTRDWTFADDRTARGLLDEEQERKKKGKTRALSAEAVKRHYRGGRPEQALDKTGKKGISALLAIKKWITDNCCRTGCVGVKG